MNPEKRETQKWKQCRAYPEKREAQILRQCRAYPEKRETQILQQCRCTVRTITQAIIQSVTLHAIFGGVAAATATTSRRPMKKRRAQTVPAMPQRRPSLAIEGVQTVHDS